ncbi:MAG: class I SAM-dependent methyltransferase [Candidatus Omnitrophica bacterium]|nr:class I SAM-dependent methyltransferase [Candidatus Omnitrophota bacterium]MDD5670734.1 class I SAM-dependent methyltransferase [Candidatus Omnitrophota bacterium]
MLFKKTLKRFFPFLFSSGTYQAFGVEDAPNKYPVDRARYLNMAAYLHEEYQRRGKPIRVLDIGCSEGMMLLYCNKNNTPVQFYGIDILEERKQKALARGYQDVFIKDIRNCDFSKCTEPFDAVICSHILEHLEDPGEFLERLKAAMLPEALLIVGVPIGLLPGILWRRYISPIYKARHRKEASLKRFGHVSFFTLPALRRLLQQRGFYPEIICGDYFIRARGFFLENYKWWFDFNQWYGRLFPGILGTVTLKARLHS